MKLDSTEALLAEAEKALKREKAKGGILKKMKKPFLLLFVIQSLLGIVIGVSEGSIFLVLCGVVLAAILSLIVVGWCYATFLLIDSNKWYYNLFAILMNGLIGLAFLLGLRYIYRKLGFTFLD